MKRILDSPDDFERIAGFVKDKIGYGNIQSNAVAVGLELDAKIIAGVIYSDFNGSNITASIAGEGKQWLNKEFLWYIHYYPFVQAGAKRITACVEQSNIVSQQFVLRLGFELECVMEKAGRTGDLLIYRMFKENCRYLERHHVIRKILTPSLTRLHRSRTSDRRR